MTLLTNTGIGLEELERITVIILIDNLNTEIDIVEGNYTQSDKDLATKRGVSHSPITLENIELQNFHQGHKPSLLEAPVDNYPNVCVMAYTGNPSREEFDHIDQFEVNLAIELMCKAQGGDQLEMEEMVNRRTHRTIDAIHNVISNNRTFGGLTCELQNPPVVNLSGIFLRRENTNFGSSFCWQGARLDYVIEKPSQF